MKSLPSTLLTRADSRPRRLALLGALILAAACVPSTALRAQSAAERAAIVRRGDAALKTPIVTVIDKPQPSPTGNDHDYVSYAIYFWPDPKKPDGLPYVSRDGERNEKQVALGDAPRFRQLFSEVPALAEAWRVTKKPAYAQRAGDWLRAWMVNPATRMTPHLEGAQIRLGIDRNKGQGGGIIDGARMHALLDGVALLDGSPALSESEWKTMREWLGDYYRWLTTSKHGLEERDKANNHGIWYRSQAASLAVFLGRVTEAREILTEAREHIAAHIDSDGSQPRELKRADGFSYSVYNLDAFFSLGLLGEKVGIDFWHYQAPNGSSLRRALDFLRPYSGPDRKPWPGKQHRPITGRELDYELAIAARVWPDGGYIASRPHQAP